MASKERKEREKAELRKKIFDAALDLLYSDGFSSLSMRKLAERIEYSPAAIYLHFESREHLARELRHHGWQLLLDGLTAGVGVLKGLTGLQAAGNAYIDFALNNPALYRLMFMGDPSLMQAAYADANQDAVPDAAFDLLLQLLRGLKGWDEQIADPKEIADIVWSSLHGSVSLYLSLPGLQESSPRRQCQLVLTLLAEGLGSRELALTPAKQSRKLIGTADKARSSRE